MTLQDLKRDTVLHGVAEIERFLLYVSDEVSSAELGEADKRNLSFAYHRLWWFREGLMKTYLSKKGVDGFPPFLFEKYSASAERDVERLLLHNPDFKTRVDVPLELRKTIEDTLDFLHKYREKAEKSRQNQDYYIVRDADGFLYKGVRLPYRPKAEYLMTFQALYDRLPLGGEIPYSDLISEVRSRVKKTKGMTKAEAVDYIQGKLTERGNGFQRYANVPERESNGKPLIEAMRGEGIRFNNKK